MIDQYIFLVISKLENEEEQIFIADIYNNYRGLMIKKSLEYVDNHHDAEDIIQKAFLKFMEKVSLLQSFEDRKLIAYIVSTIETTSIDFIRKRKRDINSTVSFEDGDNIQDILDIETPEKIAVENYDKETINRAIKKLKPKHKIVLECKYYQNMPDDEIAEILNINPKSVREYLTRARNELKAILKTEYDIHGAE